MVKNGDVILKYVPSKDNLTDIGTKPLNGLDLQRLCAQLYSLPRLIKQIESTDRVLEETPNESSPP